MCIMLSDIAYVNVSSSALQIIFIINPRHAWATRVIVVVSCVCICLSRNAILAVCVIKSIMKNIIMLTSDL